MKNKIKYQCKNCGWETSIREEWGDLRPKRCMNKKCNTSFVANKEALIIVRPEPKALDPVLMKEKKDGKTNRKPKKSGDSDEQQAKE